jgi:pilus assembly protein CpaC
MPHFLGNRQIFWFLFLFVMFLFPVHSTGAAEQRSVTLNLNESKVVKLDFVVNMAATGADNVCRVTRPGAGKEILLNATGSGVTNVHVWDAQQNLRLKIAVTVRGGATISVEELQKILSDVEGVVVVQAGQKIVVKGEVYSNEDLERVHDAVQGRDGIVNYVNISPMVSGIIADQIKKNMHDRSIKVRMANGKILLEGYVTTEARKIRAEQVASVYTHDFVNLIQVVAPRSAKPITAPPALIQVTLSVLEVDNNAMKTFGIHWNPGGTLGASGSFNTASGSSSSTAGTVAGVLSNLFPKMQNIKEKGKGRSIFEQNVTVNSGQHASFFVGDEIPIPVIQGTGAISIEYKKVGLTLKALPVYGMGGKINTQVEIESSSIANQNSGNAPWIKTSQLQTVVLVNNNESIALGGLIGNREVSSFGSVPPDGGSALFQLNNSKSFRSGKSSVLVCVTPRVLNNARESKSGIGGTVKDTFKKEERKSIGTPLH